MVSIGNIIKILKDSDVKISRKADSLKTVHEESIARLNLHFDAEDIHAIRRDGIASIESRYADGVNESLALFAELLGYRVPPRPFVGAALHRLRRPLPAGQRRDRGGPRGRFRSPAQPTSELTEEPFGASDPENMERFHRIATGTARPPSRAAAVFERLQAMVLSSRIQGELTGDAVTPRPGETASQGPTATG